MTDYIPTTEDIKYCWAEHKSEEAEFDRWLAEVIRKAKEEAWDSGYWSGYADGEMDYAVGENPYRQGEEK